MSDYLVCMRQGGYGCDYTIGCGMKYEIITANSREEVIEDLLYPDGRDETPDGLVGDYELVELIITEFKQSDVIALEPYKKEYKEMLKAKKEQTEKEERREEYLRLKKEFGE